MVRNVASLAVAVLILAGLLLPACSSNPLESTVNSQATEIASLKVSATTAAVPSVQATATKSSVLATATTVATAKPRQATPTAESKKGPAPDSFYRAQLARLGEELDEWADLRVIGADRSQRVIFAYKKGCDKCTERSIYIYDGEKVIMVEHMDSPLLNSHDDGGGFDLMWPDPRVKQSLESPTHYLCQSYRWNNGVFNTDGLPEAIVLDGDEQEAPEPPSDAFIKDFLKKRGQVLATYSEGKLIGEEWQQHIVVGIGEGCGSCHAKSIYIFEGDQLLFTLESNDGWITPERDGTSFTLYQTDPASSEPLCCPTYRLAQVYRWNGKTFVQEGKPYRISAR